MDKTDQIKSAGLQLALYWVVVGVPLMWGIWKTAVKLPALFQ
ncbi:MAG: hypothetical protein WDN28_07635 [Chthoniobacter sp.]